MDMWFELILSSLIISGSVLIFVSGNPIYSLLFLVVVFGASVILFLFLGAEFIAFLILIVYVGAVAILFLFIVMLLNLRIVEIYNTIYNYLPIGGLIGFFCLMELIFCIFMCIGGSNTILVLDREWSVFLEPDISNLGLIGVVLFNYNWCLFLMVGLILFIAMIGAIVIAWDYDDQYDINFTQANVNKNCVLWQKK